MSTLSRDFDRLEIGDRFRSPGRTITETDLVSFAALTGDFHPLHTDAEWAEASEFEGRIAHGMLLLSYSVGLVPLDPEHVLALRGFERVAFKRPVRIGDTIRVEGELKEKKELDGASGLASFEWKIVNQRDETAAIARVRVVWRRAAGPAAGAGPAAQSEPLAAERQEVYL
ncbi:MAG TPA: MaoC/PaaZ C-terminal domain-containing protein [Solirubrobacterales bacterium]|nr:MaoC/PaaZ C-terminal domain-containing protein [Solirubrobacterales bacterium]